MDDVRIDELIRRLEERPPVSEDFAAALHDRLAGALGLGPGAGRRRFGMSRLALPGTRTAPWPQLRAAWIIAMVALLAAALLGALAVGSRLLAPDPSEIVRRSLAAYDQPPALSLTFRDPGGSPYRLSADGAGTWRIDALYANGRANGTYDLYDGTRVGRFDTDGRVWTTGRVADVSGGVPPFPFQNEFTWSRIDVSGSGTPTRVQASCDGAETLGEETVAGRQADHIRCPATDMDVWLDRASRLILRLVAGQQTPGWAPGATFEVTALSVGAPGDASAFSFDGPPGAKTVAGFLRRAVGDAMPDLSGPLVGGGTFHTASLTGRPAVVFVWCPCVAGAEMRTLSDAVARRADRLGAVVVLEASAAEAAAIVEDVSFEGRAIVDETDVIGPLGLDYYPVLVLVDAHGRIASLSHQVRDPKELDAMLDALLAGEPIPPPTWTPGPGEGPGGSTALEIGQVAPDWSVPTEDGGSLAARDLVGTRAIVYFGLPQGGDDYDVQNDRILRALDAARHADPGLRIVVIDADAYTKAAARGALDALAIDQPVVADRDGIVGSAWGLSYYPSLVFLDEAGRVAWYGAGPCLDVDALVGSFEGGRPMPAPKVAAGAPSCP